MVERRRLTGSPIAKPQDTGDINRIVSGIRKENEIKAKQYETQAMETTDTVFKTKTRQGMSKIQQKNPANPSGFNKEINELRTTLMSSIKDETVRKKANTLFEIEAATLGDKVQKNWQSVQDTQAETSTLQSNDEMYGLMTDIQANQTKDMESQTNTVLATSNYIKEVHENSQRKKGDGTFMFSASQQNKMNEDARMTFSDGYRKRFDNQEISGMEEMLNEYRTGEAKAGIIRDNTVKYDSYDQVVGRSRYESDINYMESVIKDTKKNGKKGKVNAAKLAILQVQAQDQLKGMTLQMEEKDGTFSETTLEDELEYRNFINSRVAAGVLTAGQGAKPMLERNETFNKRVEDDAFGEAEFETRFMGLWTTDIPKNNFTKGITLLKNDLEARGQGENSQEKADMYSAYYNEMKRLQKTPETMTEEDSKTIVDNVFRKRAEWKNPELMVFEEGTINRDVSGPEMIDVRLSPPVKPATKKAGMGAYQLEQDANGNKAWVQRNKNGKIIDVKEK